MKSDSEQVDYGVIYPHIWNQYSVYYQSHNMYCNFFNTLAAVASIFIVLMITVATSESKLYYFTLPFFFVAPIYAVVNIKHTKKIKIPWVNKDDAENLLNKGPEEFFEAQIDETYTCATTLFEYKLFARGGTYNSIFWMVIGLGVFALIAFLRLVP